MGIFCERAEGRARELEAAEVVRHLQAREDSEALRVALVAFHVGGFRLGEAGACGARVWAVACEPVLDRVLAAVAEGRVAEIVPERGGMDDRAEVRCVQFLPCEIVACADFRADARAERAADAGDFERMREPRAGEIIFREREYLRLVLQPPECGGENDAVAVALKIGSRGFAVAGLFATEAIGGEELLPVHAGGGKS